MRSFFDATTRLALRFRWVTLIVTFALIALGIFSYTQLNQELIPEIEFPQTFIIGQNGGASSDQMLHMYSVPLEESTGDVDGVVNVESTSQKGLSFLIVRNEFGLNQSRVQEDVQAATDALRLPVRTLVPASDSSPEAMIGELSPEAVLWLYDYSVEEDILFPQQLDEGVWQAFSDEALAAFPDQIYNNLETRLSEELLARRADIAITPGEEAPELPESWVEARDDVDRFSTAEDIAELTTNRSMANIFNTLLEEGEVIGPLGTASDLTPADVQIFLDVQQHCRDFRVIPEGVEDPCSFIKELTADVVLSLNADTLAALPADYVQELAFGERTVVAQNYLASQLTGTTPTATDALLPDPWRADAPTLLTFNFSDLPLGFITISSEALSEAELEDFVQDKLVPGLRDLENVADVTVFGGGAITFNEDAPETETPAEEDETATDAPALPEQWSLVAGFVSEQAGVDVEFNTAQDLLDAVEVIEETGTVAGFLNQMATEPMAGPLLNELSVEVLEYVAAQEPDFYSNLSAETVGQLNAEVVAALPIEATETPSDAPAMPAEWIEAFSVIDVELATADDLFTFAEADENIGTVTELFNQFVNSPGSTDLYPLLTTDILLYIEQQESGFLAGLSPEVISQLNPDVVAELPIEAPSNVATVALGSNWTDLSAVMGEQSLETTGDLVAFEGNPAQTLNTIVTTLREAGYGEYAIVLINDLTPEAIDALMAADEDFLAALNPDIFTMMSAETLQHEAVAAFVDDGLSGEAQATAQAIRAGEQQPAVAGINTGAVEIELLDDPDAPELPASWKPVGNFIGSPLETADDVINTRALPQYRSGADFINQLAIDERGIPLVRELPGEVWTYLGENEATFWSEISAVSLRLIPDEVIVALPANIQNRITNSGPEFELPSAPITRTNQKSSLVIAIFKTSDANTVEAWHAVDEKIGETLEADIEYGVVFEQASFIEESISGVRNEGTSGAIMAIIVILIFMNLSIRSTLVTSVSIPTSVMTALVLMTYLPANVYDILAPILDDVGRETTLGSILTVIIRLFPESYTLNLMTLSGLTVAIGRVVDDSIVVLENIYRNIMHGDEKRAAILNGTREVSVAIFAATLTTMVVFLPLGLFGGVTGAFFLPFGLAVTYALAASYAVAITTIPVLASLFIDKDAMPEEVVVAITDSMSTAERVVTTIRNRFTAAINNLSTGYVATIKWVLSHRVITMVVAFASLAFGCWLLWQLPRTFLPQFGDPTISISVNLPAERPDGQPVTILDTQEKVLQLEEYLNEQEGVETIQTIIGGELNTFDPSVDPNEVIETRAVIQVGMASQNELDALLDDLREYSEQLFNDIDGDGQVEPEASYVRVSGVAEQGFGGFALVVSGPEDVTLSEIAAYNGAVLETL
ncbi:MAG: efflux RND transporter permease subunit, partial [Chloroflexi bacterium]|nr:efflux RND transporter permease subunit [Chloroflexota bacterium]